MPRRRGNGWDASLLPTRRCSKVKGRDTRKDTPIRPVPSAARLPAWGSLRLYYMRMEAQQLERAEPQFARGGLGDRTDALVA
jgi:hypothetical protein